MSTRTFYDKCKVIICPIVATITIKCSQMRFILQYTWYLSWGHFTAVSTFCFIDSFFLAPCFGRQSLFPLISGVVSSVDCDKCLQTNTEGLMTSHILFGGSSSFHHRLFMCCVECEVCWGGERDFPLACVWFSLLWSLNCGANPPLLVCVWFKGAFIMHSFMS